VEIQEGRMVKPQMALEEDRTIEEEDSDLMNLLLQDLLDSSNKITTLICLGPGTIRNQQAVE